MEEAAFGHTVTCGICGKVAMMTQEVEETWYPYAFLGEKEVSPVCPDHPGHWAEQAGNGSTWWEVDLAEDSDQAGQEEPGRGPGDG